MFKKKDKNQPTDIRLCRIKLHLKKNRYKRAQVTIADTILAYLTHSSSAIVDKTSPAFLRAGPATNIFARGLHYRVMLLISRQPVSETLTQVVVIGDARFITFSFYRIWEFSKGNARALPLVLPFP